MCKTSEVKIGILLILILFISISFPSAKEKVTYLADIEFKTKIGGGNCWQGSGTEYKPADLYGIKYNKSIVWDICADGIIVYSLGGKYDYFESYVGFEDSENNNGAIVFQVIGNGDILWQSSPLSVGSKSEFVRVSTKGITRLELKHIVTDVNFNGLYYSYGLLATWGDPKFIVGESEKKISAKTEKGSIITQESKQSKLSISITPQDIVKLAQKLSDKVKKTMRIAVARFKTIKINDNEVADFVQEDMITALINTGTFEVVERSELEKVLEELKLGMSDIIDSNSAKQLGKMLGAEGVLIGSISDRESIIVINARLIDTEKGTSSIAESISIPKK